MGYYNNDAGYGHGRPQQQEPQYRANGQGYRQHMHPAEGRREVPRNQVRYQIHEPLYGHPQAQSSPIEDSRYNMAGNGYNQHHQRLGATFVPGGDDDYYAPEIISPAPQRVIDVETNMQEGLAHLELESRNAPNRTSTVSSSNYSVQSPTYDQHPRSRDQYQNHGSQQSRGPVFTSNYQHTNAAAYQNVQGGDRRASPDFPKSSPFPKPHNAGPNVPLSNEDKEEVLERARPLVLKSTDPEMQLAWAQDALTWCETSSQYAQTLEKEGQTPRSITPKIEHSIRVDAQSIVSFLADQHHPKAEFMKGMWLEFGKFGYRIDKKDAFLAYRRAAEKGFARAEYRIGMQYENSSDSVKAVEHYQKGVAMHDSASNYRLGMMTLLGQHHMQQDYQRGVDMIRYAADTADENAPQGAYVYGMLLARELPNINIPDAYLPYDSNEAKLFIEKAAYLGFAKAQLKMGQAYELCQLGCEFEPALSLHYNALASRQGEAEADMAISKWFLCGYEGVFDKNEELAFTYAKRAAATKMPTAEFAMGYFYEIGMYVPIDLRESESWYARASEHGNKDALGRIDSIRKNNTLSKKDHEQVAISRIKSQYGSQRGQRPARFQRQNNPMPVMAEDGIEMPDARNTGMRPPRSSSAQRPVSVAPYPEDDIVQPPKPFNGQGLQPHSRGGPQADRPSSAFGIRPLAHANTGGLDPRHQQPPQDPMRPATSQGNMHGAAGRGYNPDGRPNVPSAGWEPQGPAPGRPPKLAQIDAGPPLSMNAHSQGYGPGSQQGYPPSGTSVDRRAVSANYSGRPARGSSMTPSGSSSSHVASPPAPSSSPHGYPQRPPQQTMSSQGGQRPSSAAPSTASAASSATSSATKKTGPATFDQMDIPQHKESSDCAIM